MTKPEGTNLDPPSKRASKRASSKKPTEGASPSPKPPLSSSSKDPIFFWKLEEIPYGRFCQWDPSPITHPLLNFSLHAYPNHTPCITRANPFPSKPPSPPLTFTSCEQFMMAHKAHLFSPDDTTTFDRIMASTSPAEQKALGQKVPNFDEDIWVAHRFEIVKWGNYLKFSQNKELKELLLGTGERELVEASPRDKIWGVGFAAKNAEENRARWGQNLLGLALMAARKRIRKLEEEAKGEGGA